MRRGWPGAVLVAVLAVTLSAGVTWAADPPALARARALYNDKDYDGAIGAAAAARRLPAAKDAAALVTARALLERYDQRGNAEDLTDARDTLAEVRVDALSARDQVELLVGLGLSLFLDQQYGSAAELFDTALGRSWLLAPVDRRRLLDWWATALNNEAGNRRAARRAPIFERIAARMDQELRQDPASAPANYWLAVAARGLGDVERAWAVAVAAWVRAPLTPGTAEGLRSDLDRLVTEALIPERARAVQASPDPSLFRAEWEHVKEQWK